MRQIELSSRSPDKLITGPVHSHNIARVTRVGFNLLPQLRNVRINGA